jgi:tetratricopeptide (TPR) repeat protein
MQRGMATEQAGDYARAAALYREAVDIAEKRGPEDERRAFSWNAVAKSQDVLGNYAGAEAAYRRALKAAEQARGKSSIAYALVLENLATLYSEAGQYTRSEPLAREALTIMTDKNPRDELGLAMAQTCLATIVDLCGRHEEAIRLATTALPVFDHYPEAWTQTLATLNTLGSTTFRQGDYAQSEKLLLRAQEVLEQHGGPDHPLMARILTNLGMLMLRTGRPDEAGKMLRRGLEIAEARLGSEHPGYGTVLAAYAAYLRQTGEKSKARTAEARANQILKENRRRNGMDAVVDITALRQR